MGTRPRVRAIVLAVATVLGALAFPQPVLAQLSNGCSIVNRTASDISSFEVFGATFDAGETVSFSINGGTATGSSIIVNGITVASSSSNPSTIFYTFPTTQVYTSVEFAATAGDAATATIVCPAVPPAPIPTLSGWAMALFGLCLGAVGSWRLIGWTAG